MFDIEFVGIGMGIAAIVLMILLPILTYCDDPNIEIQNVKEVDNGYYITINNEIYEYVEE